MYNFKIRKKKIERMVGQHFSQFLLYQIQDTRIHQHFVSISRVEFNEELTKVTIFFQSLYPEKSNQVIKLLYKSTPFFLNYLKEKMSLRRIPKVAYIYDKEYQQSTEVMEMIEELSANKAKKAAQSKIQDQANSTDLVNIPKNTNSSDKINHSEKDENNNPIY